jgi:hypothetical protein
MKIKVTEEIWKEGNMYVSYCPELDTAIKSFIETMVSFDTTTL